MDFSRETINDVIIEKVNITRATIKEADDFKNFINTDIEAGWRKIIVDLSECEFIDSTFLGSLVVSLKKLTSLGGDLRLVGLQPSVYTLFELTRMFRVFETYETIDEAISSFD